jgi:hypothetical protein
VLQIAEYVLPMLAGTITGLTAAGMLAWLFAPLARRDPKFLMLWLSTAFAYLAFCAVSVGVKAVPRNFLPFDELAFTLGCIAALSLVQREGTRRVVGFFLIVAILFFEGLGSLEVVRQAMAPSASARCSEVLKTIALPDRDKILTADLHLVGLPIVAAASDEERARHERLAKKYGVELEERAEESRTHRHQSAGGYYVRGIPWAPGGMEDLDQQKAQATVKPYWWPIQEEEWNLEYWTAQGFNIFVVIDEEKQVVSKIPAYRTLHQQIKERCDQVAVLPSLRRLFGEGEIKIYRLRERSDREQPPH